MIPRLALYAVLLTVLTNCQGQFESANWNSTMWPDYKSYQAQSDYRAFAFASSYVWAKHGIFPKGWVTGSASDEKSVQVAIDEAMANCEAKHPLRKCKNYMIGNIEVSGLTGPRLDRAIAVYAENPSATNADLLANAAQAAEVK